MRKLNNRGFTLIEVIAVVVIMSILIAILVPNVTTLLNNGRNESYNKMKDAFITATKEYIADNRYYIELGEVENLTIDGVTYNVRKIREISDFVVEESRIPIGKLLELGYLSPSGINSDNEEYIVNPNNKARNLDLDYSFVYVVYLVDTKDYKFYINDLIWK